MILDYNDSEDELPDELLDDFTETNSIQIDTREMLVDDKMMIQEYLKTHNVTTCKPSGSFEQTIRVSEFGSGGVLGINKW